MTQTNDFTTRLYGVLGAVAMSLTLFIGYFATPASTVSGVLV